jgi:hypothetical protein
MRAVRLESLGLGIGDLLSSYQARLGNTQGTDGDRLSGSRPPIDDSTDIGLCPSGDKLFLLHHGDHAFGTVEMYI